MKGRRYLDYPEKFYAEDLGLRNARLNFRKIVVQDGFQPPVTDENGIVRVGVIPFMLDEKILLGE